MIIYAQHVAQLSLDELAEIASGCGGAPLSSASVERDLGLADSEEALRADLDAERAAWYFAIVDVLSVGGRDSALSQIMRAGIHSRDRAFPSKTAFDKKRDALEAEIRWYTKKRHGFKNWQIEILSTNAYIGRAWPAYVDDQTKIERFVKDDLRWVTPAWQPESMPLHLDRDCFDIGDWREWAVGSSMPTLERDLFAIFMPSLQRSLIRAYLTGTQKAARTVLARTLRDRQRELAAAVEQAASAQPTPTIPDDALATVERCRRARHSAAALLRDADRHATAERRLSPGERDLVQTLIWVAEPLANELQPRKPGKAYSLIRPRDRRPEIYLGAVF